MAVDIDSMYVGKAPTLTTMRAAYGDRESNLWISLYLADIARFKGFNDKTDTSLINETAKQIRMNYGFMKVTELMIFFSMFKASMFRNSKGEDATRMFGQFQGDVILDCLKLFSVHRADEIDRIERAKEAERIKNAKGITYQEYLEMINKK